MNRTALPKNVRQIGKSDDIKRIYVEDYVVTFIKQYAMANSKGNFILLGDTGNIGGTQATFINGAVSLKEEELLVNEIISKEAWDDVYYRLQNYFEGYNIIGWCCVSQDGVNDDNYGFMLQKFTNIQRKNFPGNDKVFIHYNSVMMEENVYCAKDNILKVLGGYFVYYERNDKMQEYMMCESERTGTDHEYSDEITAKIREAINENDGIKNGAATKVRHGIILKGEGRKKKIIQNGYTVAAAVAVVCLLAVAAGKSRIDIRQALSNINNKLHSVNEAESETSHENMVQDSSGTLITQDVPGNIPDIEKDNTNDNKKKEDTTNEKKVNKENDDEEKKKSDRVDKNNEDDKKEKDDTKATIAQGRDYKIKEGDTLAQISKDNYGTVLRVKEICKLNGIENENMIHQGDMIKLPD